MTAAYGNSYAYDANGNQTSRTIGGVAYTLVYDYEKRLVSMSGGSVSATFVYDADGNRVKGTVNGVTTVYIGGIYEYSGGAAKSYYTGPASLPCAAGEQSILPAQRPPEQHVEDDQQQ
jgi:uncharacterized protein RhaS with RHS repeats